MIDVKAARMLGWASLAIGLTEILAPRLVQRLLGVRHHTRLLRTMGLRECISGVAILTQRRPTASLSTGLWSRVAGDALDLALLGAASKRTRRPVGLGAAITMVAGITLMDLLFAGRVQQKQIERDHGQTPRRMMQHRA